MERPLLVRLHARGWVDLVSAEHEQLAAPRVIGSARLVLHREGGPCHRLGHRNFYELHADVTLRDPMLDDRKVGDLIATFVSHRQPAAEEVAESAETEVGTVGESRRRT